MDFVMTRHRLRFLGFRIRIPIMIPAMSDKNAAGILQLAN